MTISPSIEVIARRLTELLPTVDLSDDSVQWQAQLLANYSCHVFVPDGAGMFTPTLWQAVLESSLAQLSMQAEIAELRSQTELLNGEQQRLESEIKEAEARSREQGRLIRQQQQLGWSSFFGQSFAPLWQFFSYFSTPLSPKSSTSALDPFGPDSPSVVSSSGSLGHTKQETLIWQLQRQQPELRSSSDSPKFFEECSAPPRQFASSTRQPSSPSSPKASTSTLNPFAPDSRSPGSSSGRAQGHLSKPPTLPSDLDESFLEAMRLQVEFNEEDRAIRSQRDKLAESAQRLFMCGICLEKMPYDSIACPDPCGHTFCRKCLRRHVTSRLNRHRFPVLCPTCTASKGKGKEVLGGMCYNRTVNFVILSHYDSRGFAVPCLRPRTHRRAIQYLD